MIKDRYPGVLVDVVASARGKQVYEMCKNVRYANVYDPDDDWPEPTEYTYVLGVLKVRTYLCYSLHMEQFLCSMSSVYEVLTRVVIYLMNADFL